MFTEGGEMGMNKSKGNMYPFTDFTWNAIRGTCPHLCSYCFMRRFPQGPLRFVEKELKTNLGQGNFIFVGSSTDMWGSFVPSEWIEKVLEHCRKFDNTYLFQSKNPERFLKFGMPKKVILGTTIETNRESPSSAPPTGVRVHWMKILTGRKMVSIEPILDFDLLPMVRWIRSIRPEFVSIGADSKRHGLHEPSGEKIIKLIEALKPITKVILKSNLKRLVGEIGGLE